MSDDAADYRVSQWHQRLGQCQRVCRRSESDKVTVPSIAQLIMSDFTGKLQTSMGDDMIVDILQMIVCLRDGKEADRLLGT
jgi:hypothetical protein